MTSRVCSSCKTEKPLTAEYWQRDARNKRGYHTHCKTCRRAYDAKRDPLRAPLIQRRMTLAASRSNLRSRELGLGGDLSTRDLITKFVRQGGRCYWCQHPLWKRFEIDHVKPLGDAYWCGDNAPENVCLSCPDCNRAKRDLPPVAYASRLATRGIRHEMLPPDVPVQLALEEPKRRSKRAG